MRKSYGVFTAAVRELGSPEMDTYMLFYLFKISMNLGAAEYRERL